MYAIWWDPRFDHAADAPIVVSVPAHYTGNQTFGYRVRVAPAR